MNNWVRDLDLRFSGDMDSRIIPEFNELAIRLRPRFHSVLTKISSKNIGNLEWWLSGPASRNTFASPCFHNFCCIHLIDALCDRSDIQEFRLIIVDSPALKKIIESKFHDCYISDVKVLCKTTPWKKVIKRNLRFTLAMIRKIIQQKISQTTRARSESCKPTTDINLIDTFMIPGYENIDRWYGVLWDSLPVGIKKDTFFVPTLVSMKISQMHSVYKNLRNSSRNYLIREDYLTISDYLYAFLFLFRSRKVHVPSIEVGSSDFSQLIIEELKYPTDILSAIDCYLVHRSIKRFSENEINVRVAIDWFEGHAIDKAWNNGFRSFSPHTKTIGYRAFESFPFYLCSFPTENEFKAGMLPEEIALQGNGSVATVKEFFPMLKTVIIPSFKSTYVWDRASTLQESSKFSILVALPISAKISAKILKCISEMLFGAMGELENLEVKVKTHPANNLETLIRPFAVCHKQIEVVKENSIAKSLNQSDLVITDGSSSVLLETIAASTPAIVMHNLSSLTSDPVSSEVPPCLFKRCSTSDELSIAIRRFKKCKHTERAARLIIGAKLRQIYFEPLTPEGINGLFKLDSSEV